MSLTNVFPNPVGHDRKTSGERFAEESSTDGLVSPQSGIKCLHHNCNGSTHADENVHFLSIFTEQRPVQHLE